jgi:hypothetical protein
MALLEQQRERERLPDAIRLSRATPRKTFSIAMAPAAICT